MGTSSSLRSPDFMFDRPICVLGGGGFLGFHLVQRLLAAGNPVRVLTLPPPTDHPIRAVKEIELIEGDIRNLELLKHATRNCSVVFDTAGAVAVGGRNRRAELETHTHGLRTLLESVDPKTRIVLTSSIVAVGPRSEPLIQTEDSLFEPGKLKVDYVDAKRSAEVAALAAAQSGRDIVVVNPGYLFGPEDYTGSVMGRYCSRFWRGRVLISGSGGINAVDVRDVAQGHVLAALRGRSGQRYILGGVNLSYRALLQKLAEAGGMNPRWLPVLPGWMMNLFASAAEVRAQLTGKDPFPSREHARMGSLFWYVNSRLAEQELGYQHRPLEETLRDAYCWHRSQGVQSRGFNHWWLRPTATRGPSCPDTAAPVPSPALGALSWTGSISARTPQQQSSNAPCSSPKLP